MICIIFRVDPSFVPETGTLRQSPIEMAAGKGFEHTVIHGKKDFCGGDGYFGQKKIGGKSA